MTQARRLSLKPGRAYRTRQLAAWTANPPRLAQRLVREGVLVQLAHGLFFHPAQSRFGQAPPDDAELMRAFLDGEPHVFTGPERWNALGLGTTAVHAMPLVYNTKRSGVFKLGGRPFKLRRVAFPKDPTPEWYIVDLFEHAAEASAQIDELSRALHFALQKGRFDRHLLEATARAYASKTALQAILSSLKGVSK